MLFNRRVSKIHLVSRMVTELPYRKESPNNNNVNLNDYSNSYQPATHLSVIAGYKKEASRLQWVSELNAAIEQERQRLARELHDQMGQELIALSLGLRSLKKELCSTPKLRVQLEDLQATIGRLNQYVHDIAWELRPLILDDLGLNDALSVLLEKIAKHINIKTNLQDMDLSRLKLSKFAEVEVYRIVQEALANIVKHAKAKNVEITLLTQKKSLVLSIKDDGCGFDISAINCDMKRKCLGLLGIQERSILLSGALTIITSPGNGTILKICLPVVS